MNRPDPILVDNLFSEQEYLSLKNIFSDVYSYDFDTSFKRYTKSDGEDIRFAEFVKIATEKAKTIFKSETLKPTYSLFAHYQGNKPQLHKHVDDNACTYTLDFCVYQTNPWDLYVENKAYTLYQNQALAYYGNDQEHWREDFPYGTSDNVAMIFFHFAEPDHWYFTKGPSYLSVIRNIKTEEEWAKENSPQNL